MKVIVAAGREFRDREKLNFVLDYWLLRLPITAIVHDAWEVRGAGLSALLRDWAATRRARCIDDPIPPAEMKRLGAGAELANYRRLLKAHAPERVIAFPGGAAVADLCVMARRAGVKVIEVA